MRNILFLLLWLILSNSVLAVTNDPTERLKAFKERMEATIRQNEKNDELGLSEANVYFIVDDQWIEQRGKVIKDDQLFKQINDQLKAYNAASETKFYIGLRGTGAVPAVADETFSESVSSSTTEYLRNGGAGMRARVIERAIQYEKQYIGSLVNKTNVSSGKEKIIFTFSKYYAELKDLTNGTSRKIFGFGTHYYTPGASTQGSLLKEHYASNKDAYNFISNIENNLSSYTSAAFEILKSSPFDSAPQLSGPCTDEMKQKLLASFSEHVWLEEGNFFKDIIEENPCLLRGTYKTGEGLGYETEWMKEVNQVFGAASMSISATMVVAVAGPIILRQYGAKKARDFAIGATLDAAMQVAFIMAFEGVAFEEAIQKVDKFSMLASGAEALVDNAYVSAASSCLLDGLTENGAIDEDLSFREFSGDCARGALSAYLISKGLKVGGKVFKKLKNLAKGKPETFGLGLARLGVVETTQVRTICEYLGLDKNTIDKILPACFVAGTPVVLADGSLIPIENIKAGDLISTFDLEHDQVKNARVAKVFKRQSTELVSVIAGNDTIYTTPEHPFYVEEEWVSAKDLKQGMSLFLMNKGFLVVDQVGRKDSIVSVYNFEVEEFNCYFVHRQGILVHNECQILSDELMIVFKGLDDEVQQRIARLKLGDKLSAFLEDVKGNKAIAQFGEAWRGFKNADLDDLARNTDDLEIVSDYIKRSGKSADDVAGEIPSSVTDAKKWLGDRKIEPFLDGSPNISSMTAPPGYELYQVQGRKYIRRLDTSDPYTPRLMVDENGIVVKYTQPVRSNNQPAFIDNLKAVYGDMPLNHQRHHLVSVNVVDNSAIHQEAIKRTSYSVDRAGNGRYLAETAKDFSEDASGLSRNYPTHFGSHPKYDAELNKVINEYTNALKNKYGSLDKVPTDVLEQAVTTIENRAESILKGWQSPKLN